MSTVFISGNNGFIGSYLMGALGRENLPVKKLDIRNEETLRGILSKVTSLDSYIHLGEAANVKQAVNPDERNFILLNEVFHNRFIYASSALVYGTKSRIPHHASERCSPYDAYTEFKIRREKIVMSNGGIVLRISNVYGPLAKNGVISNLMNCVLRRQPFDFAKGNSIRDYLFIRDLVEAFVIVLKFIRSGQPIREQVYNVGSGISTNTSHLIETLENLSGLSVLGGSFTGLAAKDVIRLDVAKTKIDFDWQARTSVFQGLKETWTHFLRNRNLD